MQKAQIESVKADVQAGDAKQRELLGQVNSSIADLVAQAEAARKAQEAAAAAERLRLQPPTPAQQQQLISGDSAARAQRQGRRGARLHVRAAREAVLLRRVSDPSATTAPA